MDLEKIIACKTYWPMILFIKYFAEIKGQEEQAQSQTQGLDQLKAQVDWVQLLNVFLGLKADSGNYLEIAAGCIPGSIDESDSRRSGV